jgi:hypothetical protein
MTAELRPFFMVVWAEDGIILSVAEMQWFDVSDYHLASRQEFTSRQEAVQYGRELAAKYGLKFRIAGTCILDDKQSLNALRADSIALDEAADELDALRAELAAARGDAERYRWLREQFFGVDLDLDAAIDAAAGALK